MKGHLIIVALLFLASCRVEPANGGTETDSGAAADAGCEIAGAEQTLTVVPRADMTAAGKDLAQYPGLKLFDVPCANFDYRMAMTKQGGGYSVYKITFPSPFDSPHAANNTVHGDYYMPRGRENVPSAVLLHKLGGDFTLERAICAFLASRGVAVLFMRMAYCGERLPEGMKDEALLGGDLKLAADSIQQSAMDTRRARSLLESRPEVDKERIGLVGVSLGAIVAALTVGVDGEFANCVLLLGGGNLAEILAESKSGNLKQMLKDRVIGIEHLKEAFRPVEPTAYAARVRATVLMLNAKGDEIIPRAATEALWEALGRPEIVWYTGGHVTVGVHTVDMFNRIIARLSRNKTLIPAP